MRAVVRIERAAPDPIICEGVSVRYSGDWVLRDTHLRLERGSVLGLIGRNGAGKTTLIRILLGLQQPTEGRATVFGEPSLALSDANKARLGYVPQQPDAFGWMRVKDMLEFVGRQYPRWDASFVERFLARWQISPDRPLAKLSPGERQRVALIRALAVTPDLLVLDEPAAALDPVARRDVMREIVARAAERGTTVLFSTHIVSDLERVASRVVFLHESRLFVDTPLDELGERYARVIVPNEAAGRVPVPVAGEISRRRRPDGGITLVVSRERDSRWPDIANLPGVCVDALSLEDLFIEVTG